MKFEVLSITKLSTTPAEDLDDPELTNTKSLSKRMCTPVNQQYKYLTDSFDRGSIYAACQSAFTANDVHGRNIHCFYFGCKGPVHEETLWQSTSKNKLSRILLLEEMLFTAKLLYSIDSLTLTTLSIAKFRLISKEHMKNLYKSPKNPKLKFNSRTEIEHTFYMPRSDGQEKSNESRSSTYFLDNSFHDDLENLIQIIKHFNSVKLEMEQKFLFHFPMLTQKQASKVKIQDQEFLKSFYCFPNVNPDVPIQEALKSNSKSRFEYWSGLRLTFTIPSDDYPVCLDEGTFILPLCDILMFDSLLEFANIELKGDSLSLCFIVFTQDDIDISSQVISNDQVCRYIDSQLALYAYKQLFPIMRDFEFLFLEDFNPFPNRISTPKENGNRVVLIDEMYVEECSLETFIELDSKVVVETFQFQTETLTFWECIDDDD